MFKSFDKTNKNKLLFLFLMMIVTILLATMIGSVSSTTYTISTNNSTSSINSFFKNNMSPLAKGDTVIFKAGKYDSLNLKVNKSITLKTSGKVTVKSILVCDNTKVSGFIVNEEFYVSGKSNTITNNTIKGGLSVSGSNNIITNNIIKDGLWFNGVKNLIKNNKVFKVSYIYGGKNKVISNKFKKNVYVSYNSNKITGNKVAANYKIITNGKKNILKNNKQSFRDLSIKNVGKSSKGHILSVKNVGTKSSLSCYIKIDNYDRNVYNIKVPVLKKGKSIKIIIPKRIINKLKYKYYETTYYGGYIYLDKKNKNKDPDLLNNYLEVHSSGKNRYNVYVSYM